MTVRLYSPQAEYVRANLAISQWCGHG